MNKPKTPAQNEIVYHDGDTIVVRNTTEEFGTSFFLFDPHVFGTINFETLQDALEAVQSFERRN